jgi:hypothetical protein
MADDAVMSKLNEVLDVLKAFSSGQISEMVKTSRLPRVTETGCSSDCGCRGGYCGCNAGVTANQRFENISYPEFLDQRAARIQELQMELAKLEPPKSKHVQGE